MSSKEQTKVLHKYSKNLLYNIFRLYGLCAMKKIGYNNALLLIQLSHSRKDLNAQTVLTCSPFK